MRMVESLNQALHRLLDRHADLYLLGEDIADPYGGAFGVARGLSTRHPHRVMSTPISESGILGASAGLALCGDRVIVELMFGDFATLAFDQIVNFAAKSVTMYGRPEQLRLVIRCPVGGHRGYGPTHSQSLQKHFIGVPNLTLYELSLFHDPMVVLERALERGEPAIVFEPKDIYSRQMHADGRLRDPDGRMMDRLCYEVVDSGANWVHVHPSDPGHRDGDPDAVVVAPGGTADAAVAAAGDVGATGMRADILIPVQLYPIDIGPVLPLLARAGTIYVAEESTPGGTWGTEVARHLYERLWGALSGPVQLLNSRDSVIPAARHLERGVLLQTDDIVAALRAPWPANDETAVAVTVPQVNSNDVRYVLLTWLAGDAVPVRAGEPIAEIETSKAVEQLEAKVAGILFHCLPADSECAPGDVIARLIPQDAATAAVGGVASSPLRDGGAHAERHASSASDGGTIRLGPAQRRVGEIVSAGRREIPDAFAVRQIRMDALDGITSYGPLELIVKAVGELRTDFPLCYAFLVGDTARLADAVHIGVTLDAGNGLFMPVLRDVDSRTMADLADTLAEYRMRALRAAFAEQQLAGANFAVSWNHEPGVVLVQPVIPPGLACVLSVGGPLEQLWLGDDGRPRAGRVVHLGLAHDHRLVNGRQAILFLEALGAILTRPDQLKKLAAT